MDMKNYGFLKTAAASPRLKVANPAYNVAEILKLVTEAEKNNAAIIVFPELSITGYTCGDLFHQQFLLDSALAALETLKTQTKNIEILCLVGIPVRISDRLYNCAAVLKQGKILGIVPKMYLPNYKEYYEKRWFSSGYEISRKLDEVEFLGEKVPFGNLVFRSDKPRFSLGIEICEDLWVPIPPSSYLTIAGAEVIANLSASNELVAKTEYRRQLIAQQSARCVCAYLYSSAGVHESTTDVVFGGDCLICENGAIIAASKRFSRENEIVYSEIDLDILRHDRQLNKCFADNIDLDSGYLKYKTVQFTFGKQFITSKDSFARKIEKNPFVPNNPAKIAERCEEIFNIQVAGLAKRLEHTGSQHAIIGVSGGLDSTLALLVAKKTADTLKIPAHRIIAVTMPGFGTTDETHRNAVALMKSLGVTAREIDIKRACFLHFEDIGHDPRVYDLTYENVQARERMQILMDMANKLGGIVVGTGDLSELALGWCTYNGDHMAMYSVNSGIPKTLVKFLVRWVADTIETKEARDTLYRILDTPISPELLPPDQDGGIRQKTEEVIGPYELHDFFLFYTLRYGMEPAKILFLAEQAYKGVYEKKEIKNWLKLFYYKFFANQFKRSCLPDGPKVGSVNLSPRGDWRMPSDADMHIWLSELENMGE